MKIDTYLKDVVFPNEFHLIKEWYLSLFTCIDKGKSNKYARLLTKPEVMIGNNEWATLDINIDTNRGFLDIKDTLWIDKSFISNLDMSTTETTVGRLICNKILLERPFGNIIKYINGPLPGNLEGQIALLMREGKIEPRQYYDTFSNGVMFIGELFRIFGISATEKSISPPDGIKEFKQKLIKEFEVIYGPNWTKNASASSEFKYRLEQFDKEYMSSDPTGNKLAEGKIIKARSKLFLSFGMTNPIGTDNNTRVNVIENLSDGYNLDKEQLAGLWNDIIGGSYSRGAETQKGGTATKDILRSASSVKIDNVGCKTKLGKKVKVTSKMAPYLLGRYTIDDKRIDDPEKLIDKEVVIRSPLYCIKPGSSYCRLCVGDNIAGNKDGVPLKLLDIGGKILNSMMKKMHGASIKKEELDILNNIS